MAIVDDIKRDRPTKQVLSQTNTKTVSAPSSGTGLSGDQLTNEIFTLDDFETVKNQVHIEESNFQLMEALNVIGQISNTQSQSGPIVGSLSCVQSASITDTAKTAVYNPQPGTVWQIVGLSVTNTNITGSTTWYSYLVEGSVDVYMGATSSSSSNVTIWTDSDYKNPVYISSDTKLMVNINSASNLDSYVIKTALVRVR